MCSSAAKLFAFCKKTQEIRKFSVSVKNEMRFVQYRLKAGGLPHLGGQISQDGDIFDISNVDHSIPNTLTKFLATGDDVYERAKRWTTWCIIYVCLCTIRSNKKSKFGKILIRFFIFGYSHFGPIKGVVIKVRIQKNIFVRIIFIAVS